MGKAREAARMVSKHHGKRLLILVHIPQLLVSQEAEVEMFMDCFFMLYHVWLPVQAKAAMENLRVFAIIRP